MFARDDVDVGRINNLYLKAYWHCITVVRNVKLNAADLLDAIDSSSETALAAVIKAAGLCNEQVRLQLFCEVNLTVFIRNVNLLKRAGLA